MEVILICVWLLLITVYFFYFLYIVIKWFFNKVKNLFNCNPYKKVNSKKKEKVKKVEDSINGASKKEVVTNEVKEEKQEVKNIKEEITKEAVIAKADDIINNADEMLKKYDVDNLKIINKNVGNKTEYILSGVNVSLDIDLILRFFIFVENIDSAHSILRIAFKNDKSISLNVFYFSHDSKTFKVLKTPIKRMVNGCYEYVFAISTKKINITWLKFSSFNTGIGKIYISLMEHFPITFSDVEWKVKHGDFVNTGDTLFTAKSRMLPVDTFNFVSPKNGYIVFDEQQDESMEIKANDKIVGISEEKPTTSQKGLTWGGTNGFYNEYEITSPVHGGKQYIKVPILYSEARYFIHPNLKINNKLFRIIDWLNENGSYYSSGAFATSPDEMSPRIFINDDYTIDTKCEHASVQVKNDGKLPYFIKFNEVEGNFGIDFYPIAINVITTLRGCPVKVSGNFDCERNELTSFEGSPLYVGGDFIAKSNKLSSFIGMPKYIGGCFNIANNEFDDASWEYAKVNIDGEFNDYNISNNRFIKYGKKLY